MKAVLVVLSVLVVALTITSATLSVQVNKLTNTMECEGDKVEDVDNHWDSLLGDYQIDVDNDSLYLRTEERLVEVFPMPKKGTFSKDSITEAIIRDNL